MIQDETLIPLRDARDSIPGRPTYRTVSRWCREGVNGVRLESVLIGRDRYTSVPAIDRFRDQLVRLQNVIEPEANTVARRIRTMRIRLRELYDSLGVRF